MRISTNTSDPQRSTVETSGQCPGESILRARVRPIRWRSTRAKVVSERLRSLLDRAIEGEPIVQAESVGNGQRPFLVLAHTDPNFAAIIIRTCQRLRWLMRWTGDGLEARRLTRLQRPRIVVLEADLPGESGWLTCAKLMQEDSAINVVLAARQPTPRDHRLAAFVGAAGMWD